LLSANDTNSIPATAAHPWYGLRTKSKFEKASVASLAHKGYHSYLPCYRQRRRWTDRVTEIETPLFPGYVFCRFDVFNRLPILTTPGVVSIVGIGKLPLAIPNEEIAAVERLLKSELFAEPWPFLREGQRVVFEKGPLLGLEGIVVKKKNDWRIVVSVTLLQRSVAAEIDREWVRAIK
jgi:transcription antitermination factor NusG